MKKYLITVLAVTAILLLFAAGCTRKEHPDEVLVPVPSLSSPTVVSVESETPAAPSPTSSKENPAGAAQPKAASVATPTPSRAPSPTNTAAPTNTPAPTATSAPPTPAPTQAPPTQQPTSAPTKAASQTPSAGAKYAVYRVKPGDTLFSIAVRHGTTVSEIMRMNGLRSYTIYVGQNLKVPVGYVSYVVKPGDTLYSIALTHHVSIAALVQANNITNQNLLFAGQRLIIPTKGSSIPVMGRPVYHIVKPGETLAYIAQKYGVSVRALQVANHLANPDLIYVGQRLRIP